MTRKKQEPRTMPCGAAQPTDAELEVLNVLWERGASTVREVHEALAATKEVGYTSVLKQLQGMHEKQLVIKDERGHVHIYAAAIRKGHFVEDLLDRFFSGSVSELVMQALSARKASPEQLRELHALLKKAEGGNAK